MGQDKYWDCEQCKKKVFKDFPSTWIHISKIIIQVRKGVFLADFDNASWSDKSDYNHIDDMTFCSIDCFIQWLKSKYGTNPSKR